MKRKLIRAIVLIGSLAPCHGQQNTNWDRWNRLIGEWVGEGSGFSYFAD